MINTLKNGLKFGNAEVPIIHLTSALSKYCLLNNYKELKY